MTQAPRVRHFATIVATQAGMPVGAIPPSNSPRFNDDAEGDSESLMEKFRSKLTGARFDLCSMHTSDHFLGSSHNSLSGRKKMEMEMDEKFGVPMTDPFSKTSDSKIHDYFGAPMTESADTSPAGTFDYRVDDTGSGTETSSLGAEYFPDLTAVLALKVQTKKKLK